MPGVDVIMTNAMRVMLAGVAFSALSVQAGWAMPVAGLGGLKAPGAMVLAEAEAPVDEPAVDEPAGDDGSEGSDDAVTDEPAVEEPPVEDGDTLVDPIDGWIDTPVDDDGMAWAGGDPDFCESCGGEVIEEPGEGDGAELPEGELPEVIVDDIDMWAGGSPDFCESCEGEVIDGELLPEVYYTAVPDGAGPVAVTGQPRGTSPVQRGETGAAPARGLSDDATCRQAPLSAQCAD